MAKLQQLNISFEPAQDRLLLRLRTDDDSEFRSWITRRYLKLLWGVLKEMLASLSPTPAQSDNATQGAMLAFQEEAALQKTDFQSPYKEGASTLPLGEEPVLLTDIQRKPGPNGLQILRLAPQGQQGLELTCDLTMLHSLSKLFSDAMQKAQWDLDLRMYSTPVNPISEGQDAVKH